MAVMRGERFHINLDDEKTAPNQQIPEQTAQPDGLVGDIIERTPSVPKPPSAPAPATGSAMSGWPAHKKRYSRPSSNDVPVHPPLPGRHKSFSIEDTSFDALQRQEIDAENRRRISEMSLDEIDAERKDLFENLNPTLITRLLARSAIDDENSMVRSKSIEDVNSERRKSLASSRKVSFALPANHHDEPEKPTAESHSIPLPTPIGSECNEMLTRSPEPKRLSTSGRKVSFAASVSDEDEDKKSTAASHSLPPTPPATESTSDPSSPLRRPSSSLRASVSVDDDQEAKERTSAEDDNLPPSPSLDPIPDALLPEPENTHFPKPPAVSDLDPNSDTFLDDLHAKYFPNLAHDPSKLDWMKPASKDETPSYDLSTPIHASLVRFSFKGKIIPPDASSSIPTDVGLHHHGDAPDAAGYTISELGSLARSIFPAQRCIAIQTLGRILYRLGKGEFGDPSKMGGEGPEKQRALLAQGLWQEIDKARVTNTLSEWANKDKGHRTSIALAQEAVWNWQQGGGWKMQSV
jgi:RNA polymerase II-associated protein 1